jgi:hypothetical protein
MFVNKISLIEHFRLKKRSDELRHFSKQTDLFAMMYKALNFGISVPRQSLQPFVRMEGFISFSL